MAIPANTTQQFPWPAIQLAHVFDQASNQWVPAPAIVSPGPPFGPPLATHSVVTVTAVSAVVLAANPARRRLVLHNDSGQVVFVRFGPTCTAAAFTLRLASQDSYQGPLGDYTGVVSAIRAAGTSPLMVTEVHT